MNVVVKSCEIECRAGPKESVVALAGLDKRGELDLAVACFVK